MASYSTITSGQVDADSPVTATLMSALADNPTAIAEGASGAPKIATKTAVGSSTTNLDFSSLGDFSGVLLDVFWRDTTGSSRTIQLDASDDSGSTFLGAATLFTSGAAGEGTGKLFLDFATGSYKFAYMFTGGNCSHTTGTISGASLSIDVVRLTADTDVSVAAFAMPQGGESAS
jgi:hypothetical protein